MKVFTCDLYETCVLVDGVAEHRCCLRCKDFKTESLKVLTEPVKGGLEAVNTLRAIRKVTKPNGRLRWGKDSAEKFVRKALQEDTYAAEAEQASALIVAHPNTKLFPTIFKDQA